MSKIINIVDKDNGLVASIGEDDVIIHEDYKIVETEEDQ